jgi:hypothetical protein
MPTRSSASSDLRSVDTSARKESTSWRKRRWRSDSRPAVEAADHVQHRQQVRRMPVSRAASISACDIAVGSS